MAYASTSMLASWLRIQTSDEDVSLDLVLEAASLQVAEYCGQTFDEAATEATARTFRASRHDLLLVDPIGNTTGLVVKTDTTDNGTFDTTWDAADYQLEPLGQRWAGLSDHPYIHIRAIDDKAFPVRPEATVEVTARWGWTTVPKAVELATVMHAARMHARRNSAAGIALEASFPTRTTLGLDRDVAALLAPFRRTDKWVW